MPGFSSFDDDMDAVPPNVKPQFPSDQSKKVPAGEYDVQLKPAKMKETSTGDVFTFTGVILTPGLFQGWHLERTIFFDKKNGTDDEKLAYRRQKRDELISDLVKLGFDAEKWTKANNRPFSVMLALACDLMNEMKVKMKKVPPREEGGLANTYIQKRILPDGKPEKFGPAEMIAPPPSTNGSEYGNSGIDIGTGEASAAPSLPPVGTGPGGEVIPW